MLKYTYEKELNYHYYLEEEHIACLLTGLKVKSFTGSQEPLEISVDITDNINYYRELHIGHSNYNTLISTGYIKISLIKIPYDIKIHLHYKNFNNG